MQFFSEIPNINSSPQAATWSNDFPILNEFGGSLENPQGTTDQESFLEPHMAQESGPLDLSHIMNPSLDLFNIPDELGFIMQYRQSRNQFHLPTLLT